ncbi:hypothetical protein M8C21_005355, partial [Ambrosia artemisiifolia]
PQPDARAIYKSEPAQFQLRDNPGGEGIAEPGGEVSGNGIEVRGVTEIVAKTGNADPLPKEHEQVAGLSQPSFSLGITQEAKSPRARAALFLVHGVPDLAAKIAKPNVKPKKPEQ